MRPRVRIFAPALALPPTVCSTGKDVITMSRIYTALVKPIMPRPVCFLSRLRPGPAFSLLRLATTRKLGKTRPSTISVLSRTNLVSLCPPAVVSSSREIVKAVSVISFSSGVERERERERAFIQEGNRAPVSKATHSRYRGGTPLTRACQGSAPPSRGLANNDIGTEGNGKLARVLGQCSSSSASLCKGNRIGFPRQRG